MMVEDELVALTDPDGFIKPHRVVEWAREHPESELYKHIEWDDTKAADVVEWARENPESELHKRIEWNDAKADDAYRLVQAWCLITIHIRSDDGQRGTISLIQDRNADGGYRHMDRVLSNYELRRMASRQALREFNTWRGGARHCRHFWRKDEIK
jgi:hypothetical protein